MNTSNLSLFQKGLLMIAVPLFFQIIFAFSLSRLILQSAEDWQIAHWRREMVLEANSLMRDCFNCAIDIISYTVTKDQRKGEDFERTKQNTHIKLKRLYSMANNDAATMDSLSTAKLLIDDVMGNLSRMKRDLDEGASNPLKLMSLMQRQAMGLSLIKQLEILQKKMNSPLVKEEQKARRKHEQDRKQILAILAAGLTLSIGIAAFVATFFSRQISGRIATLTDNSERLARAEALHPVQEGSDEVAFVDQKFHEMVVALKAARKRERDIIKNSEDVICSLAEDGTISFVSEAASRIWRLAPEQICTRSIYDLVAPDEKALLQQYLEAVKSGADVRPCRIQVIGSSQLIDTSWNAQWSEADLTFFCVVHDITSLKEQERIKQRFISMINQRLDGPLHALSDDLRTLSTAEAVSDRGRRIITSSISSTSRIRQLVAELMELESMTQGVLVLHLAQCQIDSVFAAACSSVQSMADVKKVRLEVPQTKITLEADEKRLTQVMVNLLSNAIKYSPQDSTVTMDAQWSDEAITIGIMDQGPGIPEPELAKLFAKFKRLERDIDRQQTGTGLGLSICKLIVEGHGGEIGAENRPEGGSRFYFTLKQRQST